MVQKLGRTRKVIKVGKISEKYDILTVEEKNSLYWKKDKNQPWNDSKSKRVRG